MPAQDKISGLVDVVKSPRYSTGVGLVLRGVTSSEATDSVVSADHTRPGILRRFVGWCREVF